MSQDSSQAPSWGSPASGLKWGSPLASNNDVSQSSSPNSSFHTPMMDRHQESSSDSPSYGSESNQSQRPNLPFRKQFSTPPNFSPRPLFHSSPMNLNPRDSSFKPRFNQNRQSHDRRSSPFGNSPYHQHKSPSMQNRSFSRDDSMSNPGGSNNIEDYFHPSMLEDPWKDLPATPIKTFY